MKIGCQMSEKWELIRMNNRFEPPNITTGTFNQTPQSNYSWFIQSLMPTIRNSLISIKLSHIKSLNKQNWDCLHQISKVPDPKQEQVQDQSPRPLWSTKSQKPRIQKAKKTTPGCSNNYGLVISDRDLIPLYANFPSFFFHTQTNADIQVHACMWCVWFVLCTVHTRERERERERGHTITMRQHK